MIEEKSQIGTDVVKFFKYEKLIRKTAKMEFLDYIENTGEIPSRRKWIAICLKEKYNKGIPFTKGDTEEFIFNTPGYGCTGIPFESLKLLSENEQKSFLSMINKIIDEEK